MTKNFLTLEQTIRKLASVKGDQPLEKDMNDQIHVGSYTSKNFEVNRNAQKLFASLPKDIDVDTMEKSANLHDLLFAIHKKVAASKRSTKQDIEKSEELEKKIMSLAKEVGLEDKHDHIKKSVDFIRSNYDEKGHVLPSVSPDDVEKRFSSPPKDYQSEISSDNDVDDVKDFHISRSMRAQRKLKIIDDEYKPGENQMSDLEKIRATFLEGYKKAKVLRPIEEGDDTKAIVAQRISSAQKAQETLKDQPNNPQAKQKMRDMERAIAQRLQQRMKNKLDSEKAKKRKEVGLGEEAIEEKCSNCTCKKCKKKQRLYEQFVELSERRAPRRGLGRRQFMITVAKGQFRKRIRNDPKIIVAHQKQGWAVVGGAEKFNPKKN